MFFISFFSFLGFMVLGIIVLEELLLMLLIVEVEFICYIIDLVECYFKIF